MQTELDRYIGCLVGLACGDAVGTTLEFKAPNSFEPITDMVGGGPFNLSAGEWTDDTSMALCLADSLLSKKKFDAIDQLQRYLNWYECGYMSSNGRCFDIGNTVLSALIEFKKTKNPYSGPSDERSAGNGSIMRLAPVVLYYSNNLTNCIEKAALSSRTTHQAIETIDACKLLSVIILIALKGYSKSEMLSVTHQFMKFLLEENFLTNSIFEIAQGNYKKLNPPEIVGSGYVVKSLQAALWAFYHSNSFEEGCLKAANLGNDADTTAAVYGQIAGAYYGYTNIPTKWSEKLSKIELIKDMAESLYEERSEDGL